MGTDSSKILEDFFSGDSGAKFSRGGHSALLPAKLREVIVFNGIPFEAFLNQATVAEGTCWTLKEVTKTIDSMYRKTLSQIKEEGWYNQVLPVIQYHKNLRAGLLTTGVYRPDWDTQLRVSRIILNVIHAVSGKQGKLAKPFCGIVGNAQKRKDNWDMHERIRCCLMYCLYYVSVARMLGMRAELYQIPGHVIVGLIFGQRVHFLDPTRGENEVPNAAVRPVSILGGFEYDYRNPKRMGYFGLVSAWRNKANAFQLMARESKNADRKRALLSEALTAINHALEVDPEYADVWDSKGGICQSLDGFEKKGRKGTEARKAYHKALELYGHQLSLNKEDVEAWTGRGRIMSNLGFLEKNPEKKDRLHKAALEAYDKALEIDGKDDQLLSETGALLLACGRIVDAERMFDTSLRLNTHRADAWAGKGRIALLQGRNKKALELFEWALKLNPNRAYLWELKGNALEKLGRTKDAGDAYKKAEELKA